MAKQKKNSKVLQAILLLGACLALVGTASAQEANYGEAVGQSDGDYSYVRTLEGRGSIETADRESLDAEENQPLVAGDWLRVDRASRLEAHLADGTLLRLGGDTEVRLDSLAWTAESADTETRLTLQAGEVQVFAEAVQGTADLEIRAQNVTLHLQTPGEYYLESDGYERTEVTVRSGYAEVRTERGSAIVRAGERARVEGSDWPYVDVMSAGSLAGLERWGQELDAEAQLADLGDLDGDYRYRATRMSRYGEWVDHGGSRAWRPHVSSSWRPYVSGAWRSTPAGLTWVSSEPWGWLPYHYGSWDRVPGHGWVWFPGHRYAPAWVYWYWGPEHVGWVPSGYYTAHYAPGYSRHRVGPRFGVYGWAGGGWGVYADWTFCPVRYFGGRGYRGHYRSGRELGRYSDRHEVPRGVIATDTRSFGRDTLGRPERVAQRLEASSTRSGLPDVSNFVAKREVSDEVAAVTRPRALPARTTPSERVARSGSKGELRGQGVVRGRGEVGGRSEVRERGVIQRGAPDAVSSERYRGSRTVRSRVEPRPTGSRTNYGESAGRDQGRVQRGEREVRERDYRSPISEGRADRAGASGRNESSSREQPVVRRVIERVRPRSAPTSSGTSRARPARPPARPSSSSARPSSSPSSRPSSQGSARGSSSSGRPQSSARSSSSSSGRSSSSSSRGARSRPRKPPGA